MPDIFAFDAILTVGRDYKPGDMPPSSYLDWHAWAEVQHRAGLRQEECGRCGRWRYPQELTDVIDIYMARNRKGRRIRVETPVCKGCATAKGGPTQAAAQAAPVSGQEGLVHGASVTPRPDAVPPRER